MSVLDLQGLTTDMSGGKGGGGHGGGGGNGGGGSALSVTLCDSHASNLSVLICG
jgi:hypothetical protein